MGNKRGSTRKRLKEMTEKELRRDLRAVTKRKKDLTKELKKRFKIKR